MTEVALDIRRPNAAGDLALATGRLTWTPTARRTDDGAVVLPAPFIVTLRGVEAQTVEVAPTGATWCWQVVEDVPGGVTRYVAVPDSETALDYADLADVDPTTLDPLPDPAAVWDAAIGAALSEATVGERRTSLPLTNLAVGDPSALTVGTLTATTWDTYDGADVIVHPSVRYFPEGFGGHRWWAAATPYAGADSSLENPSIFVSQDGITWVPPDGVTNPVVPQPAESGDYNSDPALVLGPDGVLYLFYREYLPSIYPSPDERICVRSSADGITWSAATVIIATAFNVARLMSPAVWYDPAAEEWVLLGVEILADPRVVLRYTATTPTGTWTKDDDAVTFPAWEATYSPWHLDAVLIGGQVVVLIQDGVDDGVGGRLWVCTSDDGGKTFDRADDYLGGSGATTRYKSCLSPRLTERGLEFDAWLGAYSGSWGASKTVLSSYADAGIDWAQRITHAVLGVNGYVLGDAFSRPDDGSALGTTPTGQTWSASTGTFTVSAGKAKASAAANTRATVDVGGSVSDYEVTANVEFGTGTGNALVCARFVDSSNYLRWGRTGTTTYQADRVTSGSVTAFHSGTHPAGAAHFAIRAIGTTIEFLIDDVVIHTETGVTQGQTSSKVGLQTNKTDASFDDFTVKAL